MRERLACVRCEQRERLRAVSDEGPAQGPAPAAAPIGPVAAPATGTPIALPSPGRGITASHVLGLSRTIGNAAVARAMASGALVAGEAARGGGAVLAREP